jgi:hypothetical protein
VKYEIAVRPWRQSTGNYGDKISITYFARPLSAFRRMLRLDGSSQNRFGLFQKFGRTHRPPDHAFRLEGQCSRFGAARAWASSWPLAAR